MKKLELTQIRGIRDAVIGIVRASADLHLRLPPHDIQLKEGSSSYDLVTNADKVSQLYLKAEISRLSTEILAPEQLAAMQFLAEEGFSKPEPLGDSLAWIIDPLDGTLNFSNSLPGVAISVALYECARPVLGVVLDCTTGECFDAISGDGARSNGIPIDVVQNEPQYAPITLSSGTFRQLLALNDGAAILQKMFEINGRLRLVGSQALQLCWAACGRLSLNVNLEAKLWDDAAGALIVTQANRTYQRACGRSLALIAADDPALSGSNLFSFAGRPDYVEMAIELLQDISPNPN